MKEYALTEMCVRGNYGTVHCEGCGELIKEGTPYFYLNVERSFHYECRLALIRIVRQSLRKLHLLKREDMKEGKWV